MSSESEPLDKRVARVFVRRKGRYPVSMPVTEDLRSHASSNSGTLRIEDMEGNVLWSEGNGR